jgi:predicted cupin superfamily sugar epimerase
MSGEIGTGLTAQGIIRLLDLKPHPEGGHFRETFRDARTIEGRAAATAIYFMLASGERSHWHRVDAAEVWLWHAGAALELRIARDGNPADVVTLGSDLASGERPQAVVPAEAWQAAASRGDWTLVSCVVAPGFEFSGFRLAPSGWEPGMPE